MAKKSGYLSSKGLGKDNHFTFPKPTFDISLRTLCSPNMIAKLLVAFLAIGYHFIVDFKGLIFLYFINACFSSISVSC